MALWFKIHDDALDDPRLQRLAPATFRAWFNLLCVASRNGGRLPELSALAWLLRCGRKPLARRLDELKAVGLIEDVDGGLRPVEWERRQSLRDNTGDDPQTGAERTRRWRERRDAAVRPRDEDASPRDATVTGDQDQEQESQSAPAARASDSSRNFGRPSRRARATIRKRPPAPLSIRPWRRASTRRRSSPRPRPMPQRSPAGRPATSPARPVGSAKSAGAAQRPPRRLARPLACGSSRARRNGPPGRLTEAARARRQIREGAGASRRSGRWTPRRSRRDQRNSPARATRCAARPAQFGKERK